MRDAFIRACQAGWNLCVHTRIEIYAAAALCAGTAGVLSYQHEAAKRGQIPIAYSDIEQTIADNGQNGKAPPLTMLYATLNDTVMEVFEASNRSYLGPDNGDLSFAHEIRALTNPYYSRDTALAGYAPQMDSYVADALQSVEPLRAALRDIVPIIHALDASWRESHIDQYKTVTKYRTVCDSNGKNCRSQSYTEQEYDYTDHYFRYNESQGRLAERLLKEFATTHPDIRIDETLLRATRTTDANQEAMRESRQNIPGYVEPTPEQYVAMANIWASGSNYNMQAPLAYETHGGVLRSAAAWDDAAETARNRHYRTFFRTHSGPEEFQIAENAQRISYGLYESTSNIINGISKAGTGVSTILETARALVEATEYGQHGEDIDTMRDTIVDTARELYSANYSGGFDVYPAKWFMVGVWALLAAAAGAGLGYGADRYVAQRHESGRRPQPMTPSWGPEHR